MSYNIEFISKDTLRELCQNIINTIKHASDSKEKDLHKNILDPFSAIFEASYNNISLQEWINTEKTRQIQKTLQNAIGTFHQKILGGVGLWADLKTGGVVDLINDKQKCIAEIKNKFNTTKGNHKMAIYDDFTSLLGGKYKGYTAYYVAILSKKKINKPFTPSDNRTKTRKPINENIREIDGASFYEMVTGDKHGLYKIYKVLPIILAEVLSQNNEHITKRLISSCLCPKEHITKDPLFEDLFHKAFK